MSLQYIIDTAEAIEFERMAVVAQSVSRNQKIITAVRNSNKPFKFNITPSSGLRYVDNRTTLEQLYVTDRYVETAVKLGNVTGQTWLVDYRGAPGYTNAESLFTIGGFTGNVMNLAFTGAISSLGSTAVLFYAGDIIQPKNSRYPYVVSSTVLRGTGSVVSVALNRGVMSDVNITSQGIYVGKNCSYRVVATNLPTQGVNGDRLVTFSGDFELTEVVL
jgi:hypothetical protein